VTSRRLLLLLAPLVHFLHQPAAATTAASLSGRIVIDGDLSDWAADEWVLDESTALVESGGDSHWGGDEEILRIGVTWDANFLYLAVEFRATSGSVLAGLGYAPGGLATLDGAGAFRRAIDFPFPLNVLARANARDVPLLARVDDRGVLALLDRATAPDRGEGATFTVGVLNAGTVEELFVTARVYSLDGRLVRTLYQDAARDVGAGALVVSSDDRWDGRDDGGRVAAGGVYVIALEWGLVRGGHDGRATAGVAVAR